MIARLTLFLMCCAPQLALGNPVLDYVRNYDLNDYSLGLGISGSQGIYVEDTSSAFLYPYLTSFTNEAFTEDWLILSEGDLGMRLVKDDGVLGFVGRIQTLSLNPDDDLSLLGLEQRRWTLEAGPVVGYRRAEPKHDRREAGDQSLPNHGSVLTRCVNNSMTMKTCIGVC